MIARHTPTTEMERNTATTGVETKEYEAISTPEPNPFWEKVSKFETQYGKNLLELSHENPVLLIFLRHLGCTFCRESLADVGSRRESLKAKAIVPVFVHMSDDEREVEELFSKYGVEDYARISDPQRELYGAFGLKRGTIRQIIGPKVMWRGFVASMLKGYGFGMPKQDALQLPGVFLFHLGRIVKDFRAEYSSDKPDYSNFGECEGC